VIEELNLWYDFNSEAAAHNHTSYDLHMNLLIQNNVPHSVTMVINTSWEQTASCFSKTGLSQSSFLLVTDSPRKASNSCLATTISLNPCLGCNVAVFPLVAVLPKFQETLVLYSRVLLLPDPIYSSLEHLIAHLLIL
jgi:hypothetical protein